MVYFVGAGCGAADLITLRGKRLIENAEVLIYAGSLVNPELLAYAPPGCEIYNSAKMTLEEVIDVMADANAKGHDVVRLHTGEPSIYGAVQEQMRSLDALGIPYESCPGVSACFGAAAALNLEYTQPGISQSLIITRMEGRTAVPEQEQIERFAAHGASMAIYLSTGMLEELSRRLVAGGYSADTPAAIVYKATWPDEQKYRCTVSTLPQVAAEHNIRNLAVVLVGDVLAKEDFQESRLYAPDFETGFRKTSENSEKKPGKKYLRVATFTDAGKVVAERIARHLPDYILEYRSPSEELTSWAQEGFSLRQPILFVSATGIAVRAIAPCVEDKFSDSPVLVVDDQGKNVISLLSGHMGGANELAREISSILSANAVITTATDVNGKFSIDDFARRNGLRILNRAVLTGTAQRILRGERLLLSWDVPGTLEGEIPKEIELLPSEEKSNASKAADIEIALSDFKNPSALHLMPKNIVVGIGCKAGTAFRDLKLFVEETLEAHQLKEADICAIASIDQKAEERGLIELAQYIQVPFRTYSAQELQSVPGEFPESDFVRNTVGVGNVCQRAAMLESGEGGALLVEKCAKDGMTIAIAQRKEWHFVW